MLKAHRPDAVGTGYMTYLPPEVLEKYRNLVSGIDLTDAAKDEVIMIVHAIMRSGVASAWGVESTQLALKEKFAKASHIDSGCANFLSPNKPGTAANGHTGNQKESESRDFAP